MTDHRHPDDHDGPHWCYRAEAGGVIFEEWTDRDQPAWRIVDAAPLEQVELVQGVGPANMPIAVASWQAVLTRHLQELTYEHNPNEERTHRPE